MYRSSEPAVSLGRDPGICKSFVEIINEVLCRAQSKECEGQKTEQVVVPPLKWQSVPISGCGGGGDCGPRI